MLVLSLLFMIYFVTSNVLLGFLWFVLVFAFDKVVEFSVDQLVFFSPSILLTAG